MMTIKERKCWIGAWVGVVFSIMVLFVACVEAWGACVPGVRETIEGILVVILCPGITGRKAIGLGFLLQQCRREKRILRRIGVVGSGVIARMGVGRGKMSGALIVRVLAIRIF